MGPLEVWGIADIREMTGRPAIDLGTTAIDVLASLWPMPLALFGAAGVVVLAGRTRWRTLAEGGVVLSQMVIVPWWGTRRREPSPTC